ncbi:MAG: hypothetical protein IPN09_15770 [Bacteroidetes bacterium]|nr:hypothetical protein [Bacteroidota bacterium]
MSESNHIILFEHKNIDSITIGNVDELETILETVWNTLISKPTDNNFYNQINKETEENVEDEEEIGDVKKSKQRFVSLDRKSIKPNNYIGFIQHGEKIIEIYPKIFYKKNGEIQPTDKNNWLQHIFFWLKHCDWLPARVNNTTLDNISIEDFPEFLIYYIATLIEDAVSQKPFSRYEEVEEILQSPKGRINFPAYINHGLSNGNWHQIDCVYEPFVYDNKVNQVIKYVTRVLKHKAKNTSISKLDNIVFILDEVEDRVCTIQEIERIQISDLFSEYKEILYWCKMILEQQTFNNDSYNSDNFCFLLPMEKIFEGFISTMLDNYLIENNQKHLTTQNSEIKLATTVINGNLENVFSLKTDIECEVKNIKYIIDTKYKIRKQDSFDKNNKKKGISQLDMYQMASYAIRKDVKDFMLFYPKCAEQMKDEANF